MTWAEAKLLGKQKYFTGKPCKYGHISERYTKNGTCIECLNIASKNRIDKTKAYQKKWYELNSKKIKEKSKIRYETIKFSDYEILKRKQWMINNVEKMRFYRKSYRVSNPSILANATQRRNARKRFASVLWADKSKILEMYKLAETLSKKTGIKYHVDHIYPLQSDFICGLHWEGNLQVIPAIENIRKSNKFIGDLV
jgi:hypothetical protein